MFVEQVTSGEIKLTVWSSSLAQFGIVRMMRRSFVPSHPKAEEERCFRLENRHKACFGVAIREGESLLFRTRKHEYLNKKNYNQQPGFLSSPLMTTMRWVNKNSAHTSDGPRGAVTRGEAPESPSETWQGWKVPQRFQSLSITLLPPNKPRPSTKVSPCSRRGGFISPAIIVMSLQSNPW